MPAQTRPTAQDADAARPILLDGVTPDLDLSGLLERTTRAALHSPSAIVGMTVSLVSLWRVKPASANAGTLDRLAPPAERIFAAEDLGRHDRRVGRRTVKISVVVTDPRRTRTRYNGRP